MFIGRESNLETLGELWKKRSSSLVVISGRRRIGKSTLVEKFAERSRVRLIEIVGLAPDKKMTNEKQLENFCERLSAITGKPQVKADCWPKAFDALRDAVPGTAKTVIFLDEISWMGKYDSAFAGYLKNAWDQQFSRRPNLVFVVAGSVSSWIQENLLNSRAFVGRFSVNMHLPELNLVECRRFWGELADKTADREILDMLSVTGGIPKYLEEMDPHLTTEENIRRLCFTPEGYLFNEFDVIFNDVFTSSVKTKRSIVECLADGPASATDLAEKFDKEANGHLSNDLKELCEAGFVAAAVGNNPSTGEPAREIRYRLSDNYLRFYLKFIEPKAAAIRQGLYRFRSLEDLVGDSPHPPKTFFRWLIFG